MKKETTGASPSEVVKSPVPEQATPKGENLELLMQESSSQTLEFEHKDYLWVFRYRLPTWGQQMAVVSKCTEYGEKVTFLYERYYEEMLMVMILDGPKGWSNAVTYVRGLDREVIKHLISIVPAPEFLVKEADERKKE